MDECMYCTPVCHFLQVVRMVKTDPDQTTGIESMGVFVCGGEGTVLKAYQESTVQQAFVYDIHSAGLKPVTM